MFKDLPKIVLVSGAPGAGKTTLAIPLARELNFTPITKDVTKETLSTPLTSPFWPDKSTTFGGDR